MTKLEKMLCFNWNFFSTFTHTLKSFNSKDSVVLSYCVAVPLLYYIFWFLSLFLTDFYYIAIFYTIYILQFSKSNQLVLGYLYLKHFQLDSRKLVLLAAIMQLVCTAKFVTPWHAKVCLCIRGWLMPPLENLLCIL